MADDSLTEADVDAWPSWPPEADEVVDLLGVLTPVETDAIRKFVTRCRTSGNWKYIGDFWHFGLDNTVAAYRGWKSGTIGTTTGDISHIPDVGFRISSVTTDGRFETGIALSDLPEWEQNNCFMGGYFDRYTYSGTSTDSRFGVENLGSELQSYLRSSTSLTSIAPRINDTTGGFNSMSPWEWGTGLWSIRRGEQNSSTSTLSRCHHAKLSLPSISSASSGVPTGELWVGQINADGSPRNDCRPQDIYSFVVGSGDLNYQRFYEDLMRFYDDLGFVTNSVQQVLDRFSALTAQEEAAIKKFVLGQIACLNWQNIDEFYCFALNGTDWLTGFKTHTATVDGPNLVRTDNGAQWEVGAGSSYIDTGYTPNLLDRYTDEGGIVGSYLQEWLYTGTARSYIFGVGDATTDIYLYAPSASTATMTFRMNSGSDTNVTGVSYVVIDEDCWMISAVEGTSTLHRNGESSSTTGTATATPVGQSMYLGRYNDDGTPSAFAREHTQSVHFIGGERINPATFSNGLMTLLEDLGVETGAP
jgi:hypothetical protein